MPKPTDANLLKNTTRAHRLLREVAARHDIDVKSMRDCSFRFDHLVQARREFCLLAHETGIGSVTIGKVLGCTPGSVRYHLRPEVRAHKSRYYRARRETAWPSATTTSGPA